MSWNGIAVTLRLRSDIHLGDLPLGFVARTFPFVPCHLPFFALIPAAVEGLALPSKRASYIAMEKLFANCVRSTAFFVRDNERLLFPWNAEDRLVLESSYLHARYGVMLDDNPRSAIKGRLYETEVLLASKRGSLKPTVLEGALFLRAGTLDALAIKADGTLTHEGTSVDLPTLLDNMRLGGDRTRALGLPAHATLAPFANPLFGLYTVNCEGDWPTLEVPTNTGGPVPLALHGAEGIEGRPMVLTGRRYTDRGSGLGMDPAKAAYLPGWIAQGPTRIALATPRAAVCLT